MKRIYILSLILLCARLAFAQLPATDTFTDTGGTQLESHGSPDWTLNANGFAISGSGTEVFGDSGVLNMAHWISDTFDDDQYAEIELGTTIAAGAYIGPGVRIAASAHTGYVCHCNDTSCGLNRYIAGSETALDSASGLTNVTTDLIRLEVSGTSLTCKKNGMTIASATDSMIASGSAGIGGYSAGYGDNWEGGNLSAGMSVGAGRKRVPPIIQ